MNDINEVTEMQGMNGVESNRIESNRMKEWMTEMKQNETKWKEMTRNDTTWHEMKRNEWNGVEWNGMNESMIQWTNESVHEWASESTNQWVSSSYESVNQWTNEWMDGCFTERPLHWGASCLSASYLGYFFTDPALNSLPTSWLPLL